MVLGILFLVAIVGFVLYLISGNAKIAEVGRLAFWVGLLAGLVHIGGATLALLR
jgi:hypothetical protein